MTDPSYDAIVVGARCAGSPTAMLLARKGYRVLLVDKATFPSDTMSTHLVHPPGVAALERWGLLERLEATGCPPVDDLLVRLRAGHDLRARRSRSTGLATATARAGPCSTSCSSTPPSRRAPSCARASRSRRSSSRTATVDRHPRSRQGRRDGHRARPGRDRRRRQALARRQDRAARAVQRAAARSWRCTTPTGAACRSAGFDTSIRAEDRRGWAAHPDPRRSHASSPFGWPVEEFHANRERHRGQLPRRRSSSRPSSPSACAAAKRESKFVGSAELPGYFRKPFGPGWALVGDAGYHKNPITAHGHQRRVPRRRAGAPAPSTTPSPGGARSTRRWATTSERATSEALPIYEFTDEFAQLEPPPPEMQQLLGAMHGNQEAMDGFVSVQAGTLPAPEFFAPENVGRIMSAA